MSIVNWLTRPLQSRFSSIPKPLYYVFDAPRSIGDAPQSESLSKRLVVVSVAPGLWTTSIQNQKPARDTNDIIRFEGYNGQEDPLYYDDGFLGGSKTLTTEELVAALDTAFAGFTPGNYTAARKDILSASKEPDGSNPAFTPAPLRPLPTRYDYHR